ncbi:MAG: hypothetical protein K1Y36_08845 [Blastocatellia bacterium]|nr:hypothetical protein [Blastocatellia bacterium]
MWLDVAHPAGTGVELEHSLGQTQWTFGGYKTGTGPGEPAPSTQCGFILFEPLLEGID